MKHTKTSQPKALNRNALKLHSSRVLVALLSYQLVFQPVTALAESFKVEGGGAHAPNNQRPFVDGARNGVPVVNINTPNSKGLSHNTYNQFNVSNKGLLLNNSATNVSTQLGGFIEGNANLRAGQEAKLILNEVVGATRSQLNGYIEVAGQRADVVVANPNGITCNGCGFINTDRGVLTTGSANFNSDGSLKGFRTTNGDIEIQANGLDGSGQKRIDLLAKAVKVYGKVKAQGTLNIVTGDNSIDFASGKATKHSDSNDVSVGLDVSSLGGMYANQINLRVTDKGAGVNMQSGELIAMDQINLTADGNVTLAGTNIQSKTADINIQANDINAQMDSQKHVRVQAKKNIKVKATNDVIANKARFESDDKMQLTAGNALTFDSVYASSANSDSTGSLTLNAGYITLKNKSKMLSKGGIAVSSLALDGYYKIEESTLASIGQLDLKSKNEGLLVDATLTADQKLAIQATDLSLKGASANSKDQLALNAENTLLIDSGSINTKTKLGGAKSVAITAAGIDSKNLDLIAKENVVISATGESKITDSEIKTGENLTVTAQKIVLNDSTLSSSKTLKLDSSGQIQLDTTVLNALKDIELNAVQTLTALKSDVSSREKITVKAAALNLTDTTVVATDNIDIQSQTGAFDAQRILLSSQSKINLESDSILLKSNSVVVANKGIEFKANTVDIQDSSITNKATDSSDVQASLDSGDIALLGGNIILNKANIGVSNNLTIANLNSTNDQLNNATSLHITDSKLVAANGDLNLAADTFTIDSSFEKDSDGKVIRDTDNNPTTPSTQLWAGKDINIQTHSLANNGGLLWAAQNINIDRDGQGNRADSVLNKEGALVASTGDLNIKASRVDNISKTPTFIKDGISRTWEDTASQSTTNIIEDTNKLIKSDYLSGNTITDDQQNAYLELLASLMDGTPLTDAAKTLLKADVVDTDGNILDSFKGTWDKLATKAAEKGITNYNNYLVSLLKNKITREEDVPATDTEPATTKTVEVTVVDANGNVAAEFKDELLALWLASIKGEAIPENSLALVKDANQQNGQLIDTIENKLTFVRSATNSNYTIKYFLTADKLNGDGFMARMVAGNNINIDTDTFNNEHANLSAGNSITIDADSSITNKAFAASQVIVEVHKKGCFTCHTGKMGYGDTFGGKIEAKGGIMLNVAMGSLHNLVQDSSDNTSKLNSLLAQANGESNTNRTHLDESHDDRTTQAASITQKKQNQATLSTKAEDISQASRTDRTQISEDARTELEKVTQEAAVNALNSENSKLAKAVLDSIKNAETAQLITADGVVINVPLALLATIADQIDTSQVPLSEYKNYLLETRFTYANYRAFLSSSFMAGRLGNHSELRDELAGTAFHNQQVQSDQFVDPLGGGWSGPNTFVARENALNNSNWQKRLQRGLKRNNHIVQHNDFVGEALATAMKNGGISPEDIANNSSVIYGAGAGNAIHQGGALLSATQIDLDVNGDVVLQGKLSAEQQLAIVASGNIDSEAALKAKGDISLQGNSISQTGESIEGDNLNINAQQNINLVGTTVNAKNAINLDAKNDINITAQNINSEGVRGSLKWKSTKSIASTLNAGTVVSVKAERDVTLQGSGVNAQQDINIEAQRDISLKGSSVSTQQDIAVTAGRDVNLISEAKTSKVYQNTTSTDQAQTLLENPLARTTITQTQIRGTQTVQNAASLNSGGNLTIDSGRDINLTASKLNSKGDINAKAQGAINIKSAVAKRDVSTSVQQGSRLTNPNARVTDAQGRTILTSSAPIFSQLRNERLSEQTQIGSQIAATGNINFSSGKDTNISASKMVAQGDLNIKSQGDLNIRAAKNQVNTRSQTGGISESSQESLAAISTLQALGNVTLDSQKNIDIEGSAIEAINKLDVTAAGDINISAVQQQKNKQKVVTRNYTRTSHSSKHGDSTYTVTTVDRSSSATTDHKGASLKGDGITIKAGNNVTTTAANINSSDTLKISAKGDVNLLAKAKSNTTSKNTNGSSRKSSQQRTNTNVELQSTTLQSQGDLVVAGNDINVQASDLAAQQKITLLATNNINLKTAKQTSNTRNTVKRGWNRQTQTINKGANLKAGNDVELVAGNTLTATAAKIDSDGDINLTANDIKLKAAYDRSVSEAYSKKKSGSFFSKKTTTRYDRTITDTPTTTLLSSGDQVNIISGGDIDVEGSQIVAQDGTTLAAAGDINTTSVATKRESEHYKKVKRSGIFGGGGLFGITIGSQTKENTRNTQQSLQNTATIGGLEGNVALSADNNILLKATDVVAGGDIDITANNVTIESAIEEFREQTVSKVKQSGISLKLTGGVISSIETIKGGLERIENTDNSRLKALQAVKGLGEQAGNASNFGDEFSTALNDPKGTNQSSAKGEDEGEQAKSSGINLEVSIGSSKSESRSSQEKNSHIGSSIAAGNDLNITARGDGTEGNGDITATGAVLKGKNVNLSAADKLALLSGENTEKSDSSSKSSSTGIGVSIGSGGVNVFVEASQSRNKVNKTDDKYLESVVEAANQVTVTTGGDTELTGAQVKGEKVVVDVGGDLNITSQQDESHFKQRSKSIGGRISVGYTDTGAISANLNYSKTDADSKYKSVQEQAGIFAGKEGFDVNVDGNTDLVGGAIVSDASSDKNSLSTDKLNVAKIENNAKYDVDSVSVSVGTSITDNIAGNISGGFGSDDGSASNTTYSAISQGNIEVRSDPKADLNKLAALKRSKEEAHQVLERIFSQDKITQVQEAQEVTQMFAEQGFEFVGDLYSNLENAEAKLEKAKELNNLTIIAEWEEKVKLESAKLPFDKTIAHAIVGGMTAISGGGNFLQGAMAAGLNEAAASTLAKEFPENQALQSLAAAAIGGIAGSTQSALITASANKFNRQLHPTEIDLIAKNAEGFAVKRGLCVKGECSVSEINQAEDILTKATLSQVDSNYEMLISESDDYLAASRYLKEIAAQFEKITDASGREQSLFDERGNDMFNQQAVNAEYVYENKELYDSLLGSDPRMPPGFNSSNAILNRVASYIGDTSILDQELDVQKDILKDLQDAYLDSTDEHSKIATQYRKEMVDPNKEPIKKDISVLGIEFSITINANRSNDNVSGETYNKYIKSRFEMKRLSDALDNIYTAIRGELTQEEQNTDFAVIHNKTVRAEMEAIAELGMGLAASQSIPAVRKVLNIRKNNAKNVGTEGNAGTPNTAGTPNSGTRSGGADAETGTPFGGYDPRTSSINYDTISTAKPHQATAPRDLNEQTLWNRILDNPSAARDTNLSGDARFPRDTGWKKMEASHTLPDGTNITVHYQFNSITGKPYDMKFTTPQRLNPNLQPGPTID